MWPAALIVGMFVLIGALGTASAPTAYAGAHANCAIEGPFPNVHGDGGDNDLLVVGGTYLFIVVAEDAVSGEEVDVDIDDETGDADFVGYAI